MPLRRRTQRRSKKARNSNEDNLNFVYRKGEMTTHITLDGDTSIQTSVKLSSEKFFAKVAEAIPGEKDDKILNDLVATLLERKAKKGNKKKWAKAFVSAASNFAPEGGNVKTVLDAANIILGR